MSKIRSVLIRFCTIFFTILVLVTLYQYIVRLAITSSTAKVDTVETSCETLDVTIEIVNHTESIPKATIPTEETFSETVDTIVETTEVIVQSTDETLYSTETTNETFEPTVENSNTEADATFPIVFDDTYEEQNSENTEFSNQTHNQIGVVANLGNDVLNVRTEPNTNSERIIGLPKDYLVIVCETIHTSDEFNSIWYKIMFKNTVGYVSARYIDILEDVSTLDSKEDENWTLVSTGTTQKISSENREYNIALACSMFNQKVVPSGEFFSWNDTVGGECCEDNGFKEAPVFITNPDGSIGNGVGFGGGVCQVSTTINIAIKNLGIGTNASIHGPGVSYATPEEEASISYPYTDLYFTNTLDKTIILEMISFKGSCMCNVYVQNFSN